MNQLWLRSYDADVPHSVAPYPHRTLLDYVSESARAHPSRAALLFEGGRVTYGRLERASDAFAAALATIGVRKGDRVALLLPNCPQFVIAELGAWKAGAIVAPLNPIYPDEELSALLAANGAETIVTLTAFYDRLKRIQPQTRLRRVIAANIKEHLPYWRRVLFTLLRERRLGHRAAIAPGDFRFAALLASHHRSPRPEVQVTPEDPATILPSGGTTGTPKGVVGAHHGLVKAGLQLRAWLQSTLAEWHDTLMLPLPLFHVYGCTGVQSLAFVHHLPLALIPNPRDIGALLQAIVRVRPSFLCGVPTLFNGILNHPDVKAGNIDFRSVKLCFSGAAPLMAETRARFEELTGGRILEGYSLTEGQMAVIANPVRGEKKLGSIGIPLPDVQVRIVDAEEGDREVAQGEVGEIIIHAPQLMQGYWRNPEETDLVLRTHDEGRRWLHTGDLGYMDPDGYIFIVDRKKDMIKVSGFQVWPREVEEVIAAHPAVLEAGVAAVPDPGKGEVPKAWVVLRAGATAEASQIRAFCRERLAPYKVPARVVFVAELPKTSVGKVLRRKLAELPEPAEAAEPAE